MKSICPKQCLHLGVLAELRAGRVLSPARASAFTQNVERWVFKLFQKKWSWRSSFEVRRFIFWWMLQLICLFCLQNSLWPCWLPRWSQGAPEGSQGGSKEGTLGGFGAPLGSLGTHLGSFSDRFEVVLGSFGVPFGIFWGSFLDLLGIIWESLFRFFRIRF